MSLDEDLRIEAYLNLLAAIQDRAIQDGELHEFEEVWFYSPRMIKAWRSFCRESGVLIGAFCEKD